MRAFTYFVSEATGSLWRRPGPAAIAMLTIAAGLFVLGFFLVLNVNLDRVLGRWSQSAELSVYLDDDATAADVDAVEATIDRSGLAAGRERLTKDEAAARFRQDFPDLAEATLQMEGNPFPASVEVRLRPEVREAGAAVDALAASLGGMTGVADVRYDRRWIARLNAVIVLARGLGLVIVGMLGVAAALTVASVVRLAAIARRDEIHIMQLVGAPLAYVRGPFVVEGILQGGLGALAALLALWGVLAALQARFGAQAADVLGAGQVAHLPPTLWVGVVGGGMLLGCLGGLIVARSVR